MKKTELRRIAWQYAAGWLASDCDGNDIGNLDGGTGNEYTEDDEEYIREFIRNKIVGLLEKRGKMTAPMGRLP